MSLSIRQLHRVLCAAALAATAACGGDPAGPNAAEVAGTYTATSFTTTSGGTSTDQLAAGAAITLQLTPQGTTTGRLLIPDAGEDGGDFDADLAGAWTLRRGVVELDHAADTFLRDMPLVVQGTALAGDATFAGTRIRLTLTKQ